MSALPRFTDWTWQEYLDYERRADLRHEYLAGEVYAMAGATERHNQIASALHFSLYGQLLERPCQVFQSDMLVQATPTASFYPDVVVVCGEAKYLDDTRDVMLNPTVLIEVLSPSTADYDRGSKFTNYRQIPSLQDYLLVSQRRVHAEHYTRQDGNKWLLADYDQPSDTIQLPSIGCTLLLSDIYRKVQFDDLD